MYSALYLCLFTLVLPLSIRSEYGFLVPNGTLEHEQNWVSILYLFLFVYIE